ncbi:MAG: CRISPR-associated endonuclease Cas2 [Lachnospiraceae bacterium]|nr:CRISPR-associated endonuclease Cas2 [Lachnospiraceae bacterium]
MRIIVLFDLPVITADERREYVRFRKHLIKSGFVMMQQSVYSKLVLNTTAANAIIENCRKNKPRTGLVQILAITEKQFSRIEFLVGERSTEIIDNDKRLIVL